jgi:alpha-tubulin suppressor-like RCC1 family protein
VEFYFGNIPKVKCLAAGPNHTVALTEDGKAWGWGNNENGELDQGCGSECGSYNQPIHLRTSGQFISCAAGRASTFLLEESGTVLVCGRNFGYISGANYLWRMTQIPMFEKIQKIAAGERFILGVDDQGFLFGSGISPWGVPGPKRFEIENVRDISAGENHSLILDSHGFVWGIGSNSKSELGGKQKLDHLEKLPELENVSQIYCGSTMSWVKTADGNVFVCGENQFGQLLLPGDVVESFTENPVFRGLDIVYVYFCY